MDIKLNVNGFDIEAHFSQENIDELFMPLLRMLSDMQKAKRQRLIVYLAAPPGTGKTTLSIFLEWLSGSYLEKPSNSIKKIQALSIDGFHYPQAYIKNRNIVRDGKTMPMQSVKGSPETFDLKKLSNCIKLLQTQDIKWPIYDRNLHDIVDDAVLITEDIVLIEGNWLLLDDTGWRELKTFCDYSIFIVAKENMLKQRLIQRKILGGQNAKMATDFYNQSDCVNVTRALNSRLTSDYELMLSQDGKYFKSL